MSKAKIKHIPRFKSEDEEREFWAKHDVTDYFDMEKAEMAIFPNLKSSSRRISIRLPETLVYRLKQIANAKDVPYQSLMKIFLAEKVKEELTQSAR
jgi:predicted DNA binding CopG/RHH family protein